MKKVNLYVIIGTLVCFCAGCRDFLEEYSPDKSYVRSYSDLDELLVGEAYMKCNNPVYMGYHYNSNMFYWPYTHYMADETEIYTGVAAGWNGQLGHQYLFGYYCWQEDVTRDIRGDVRWDDTQDWETLYKFINITNTVLSLIDKQEVVTTEDEVEVRRIKGESHFLRGAYYFILTNLYGQPYAPATAATDLSVPIKLSEYIEDRIYTRASVQEVYAQIVDDLLAAEEYLRDVPEVSQVRAGYTATCLMLSRVYLYMQKYEESLKWAKVCVDKHPALIDLNEYYPGRDTTDFLSIDSPELIFTMGTYTLGVNITGAYGEWAISTDLYDTYAQDDLRKEIFFIQKYGLPTYGWMCGKTYRTDENHGSSYVSDNFLMRSAEAYLNLAEAAACLGGGAHCRSIGGL